MRAIPAVGGVLVLPDLAWDVAVAQIDKRQVRHNVVLMHHPLPKRVSKRGREGEEGDACV